MSSSPSAQHNLDRALARARELLVSDPTAAAEAARKLLASTPRDPAALRILGAALRELGRSEEAEQAETEAIAASASSPEHREIARAISAKDMRRAAAMLEVLVARDDTDVRALAMLGRQRSLESRFGEAERLLLKALERAPADMSIRIELAEHLRRSRQPARAVDTLDQLPPKDQVSRRVRSIRADLLSQLGRFDEEIEILEGLLAESPSAEEYRIRLGHALRTVGRSEEAVAVYRDVLSRRPDDGIAWWSLANLKTARFSAEDIAMMKQAFALSGQNAANQARLGSLLGRH